MTKLPSYIDDVAAARLRAEQHHDRLQYLEHACHLIALGQRLRRRKRLLDRHDLYLAFNDDQSYRYPGLYLIKRNHSRWARIWVCAGGFRIDAQTKSACYNYDYDLSLQDLMSRDLSIDLDIAERAIVALLERDELVLGNRYLPNKLTADLDSVLPDMLPAKPAPAALPPPTLELKAIEVKPVMPVALKPVALARKPLPPRQG